MSPPPFLVLSRCHLTAPCSPRWYSITIRPSGADDASVLMKQVEASLPLNVQRPLLCFLTHPYHKGCLMLKSSKLSLYPYIKQFNEESIAVDTEQVEEWSSFSKATGKHIDTK